MNQAQAVDYVKASAIAMALPMDDARAERVAAHLVVACKLARLLDAVALEPGDEPAEIYRPAPFPGGEAGASS